MLKMLGFLAILSTNIRKPACREMLYELLLHRYTLSIHPELSEALIILRVADVVKWRFLRSLRVKEHCTEIVLPI
jgi:hypothetical protein